MPTSPLRGEGWVRVKKRLKCLLFELFRQADIDISEGYSLIEQPIVRFAGSFDTGIYPESSSC